MGCFGTILNQETSGTVFALVLFFGNGELEDNWIIMESETMELLTEMAFIL